MKRKRDYFRYQRTRAIRRKYGILVRIYGKDEARHWYNGRKGSLSKNKIHCSCWMCKTKSYDTWKFRDQKILDRMDRDMKDFYREI